MSEYAVLIPWVITEDGEALLMEVRSDKVRQPGEVCFPGGRIEIGESASETAVREACEELGIMPDAIEVISEPEAELMLDGRTVHAVSARLHIDRIEDLDISEDEVAEIFLLPADWLKDNPPEYYLLDQTDDDLLPYELHKYLSNYGEYRRKGDTYYWEFSGHGIWGLTARLIKKYVLQ